MNRVLKAERPDIDQKRSDLLKMQGEFQLRLRHLEKNLLQCLNEVKGRILDDNTVISTLETLKKEAADVSREASETDETMKEIERTSHQYLPLASACSSSAATSAASGACGSAMAEPTGRWRRRAAYRTSSAAASAASSA